MKFLWQLITEPWQKGGYWMDRVLSIVTVLVLAFVLYLPFIATDSWFVAESPGTGEIVSSGHTAEYYSWQGGTKDSPGYMVYHPPTWSLKFQVGDEQAWMSCNEYTYNLAPRHRPIPVTLRHGRMSGWLYVTGVSF